MVMNKVIRVLVANQPKIMREVILATLAEQPDIEIVGEVSDEAEIEDCVNQTLPDLLVVALDEPGKRPLICDSVLNAHPSLRIIAVASGQNRSICYWASLQIQSNNIDLSEEGILSAARSKSEGTGGHS
jgi:chemotaxis response regulator CheB